VVCRTGCGGRVPSTHQFMLRKLDCLKCAECTREAIEFRSGEMPEERWKSGMSPQGLEPGGGSESLPSCVLA